MADKEAIITMHQATPCVDPEGGGGRGFEPSLENHKAIGFLSNQNSSGPPGKIAIQCWAIETPFKLAKKLFHTFP